MITSIEVCLKMFRKIKKDVEAVMKKVEEESSDDPTEVILRDMITGFHGELDEAIFDLKAMKEGADVARFMVPTPDSLTSVN